MSLNKKLIRNAIIATVLLAFLGAGYFFAVKWQPESDNDSQTDYESILVFSTEEQKISKLVFQNGSEIFSVTRTPEKKWAITEREDIQFSQSKLQSAVYNLTAIRASKELDNSSVNLSDFGLEKQDRAVTIHTDDGAITLILGDKLAVDSKYYMMVEGRSKVYVVSDFVASSIHKTPDEFRETSLAVINREEITKITIKNDNKRFIELDEVNQEDTGKLQMASLSMIYPYKYGLDAEAVEQFLSEFLSVEVIDFISNNIADSKKYGIENGWSIEIKDGEQTHNIRFGNSDENGNVYATYNDCGYIFTMSPGMHKTLKDTKPFDLIDKFAHLYMIDKVKSINIKFDNNIYTMSIGKSGDSTEYKINDKIASEEAFKAAYQIVVGRMVTDTVKNETLKGSEVANIAFNMIDGTSHVAKYYEYDDRSYMIEDEGQKFLILKKYIDELKETIKDFSQNPNTVSENK